MTTLTVPIDSIIVGERRREEMGDIAALADSINSFGLLHPIVIDADYRLVAGGRRLAALRRLGHAEVEARLLGTLSEAERREIELEENLRRKDLTPYERSRTLTRLAETTREVAKEFRSDSDRNSTPGRPKEAGSLKDVSQRTGYPKTTIIEAQQHVAAAEKYPELKAADIPQAEAIQVAAQLDRLPEPEREPVRAALRETETAPAEQRKVAREQAKSEAATKERILAIAGDPDGERARADLRFAYSNGKVAMDKKLLSLDATAVAAVLDQSDREQARWFIRGCRRWLDALEAGISDGLRVVGGTNG